MTIDRDRNRCRCELCHKAAPLCVYRSDRLVTMSDFHGTEAARTYVVAICGDCAAARGYSRWFESPPTVIAKAAV